MFGLAEPRLEGGKFWPNDYLYFNGSFPSKDYYTEEEKQEYLKLGYTKESVG